MVLLGHAIIGLVIAGCGAAIVWLILKDE